MVNFIFIIISLFSFNLQAKNYEEIYTDHKIEYNEQGIPEKLIIQTHAIIAPIIDGMVKKWAKKEFIYEQIFNINSNQIEKNSTSNRFENITNQNIVINNQLKNDDIFYNDSKNKQGFYCKVNVVPHQFGYFESMSNAQLLESFLYNIYCQIIYHMTNCEKSEMMQLHHKKFVEKLLSDELLSEQAILQLWNEYKPKMWADFKESEQKIKAELKCRQIKYEKEALKIFLKEVEKQKILAQQELDRKKLEQQYLRNIKFVKKQYDDFKNAQIDISQSDQLWQMRDLALQNSEMNEYEQYEQKYELDLQTRSYLKSKNFDYQDLQKCFGTDLQQQFHQEICDIFKQAAKLESKIFYKSCLLESAYNFSDAANESNKKEQISVTGALSFIGTQLVNGAQYSFNFACRYVPAVVNGVIESGQDFANFIMHPIETVTGLGSVIFYVLESAAILQDCIDFPNEQSSNDWKQRETEISNGLVALKQHFIEMDGPSRVKALTKFGSDFIIPGKIISACSHLLGAVCVKALDAKNLKLMTGIAQDNLAFETVAQEATELEQGVVQNSLNEFMQSETQIAKTNIIVRSFNVVRDEIITVYKGVIPFNRPDLKHELTVLLKAIQQELKNPITEKIKKIYGQKIINAILVRPNFDHLFNFEFKQDSVKHSKDVI